jgi:hypothetical protein
MADYIIAEREAITKWKYNDMDVIRVGLPSPITDNRTGINYDTVVFYTNLDNINVLQSKVFNWDKFNLIIEDGDTSTPFNLFEDYNIDERGNIILKQALSYVGKKFIIKFIKSSVPINHDNFYVWTHTSGLSNQPPIEPTIIFQEEITGVSVNNVMLDVSSYLSIGHTLLLTQQVNDNDIIKVYTNRPEEDSTFWDTVKPLASDWELLNILNLYIIYENKFHGIQDSRLVLESI